MPLVRFNAKAFHNGSYMEPGAMCVVDDAELGPHMDVVGDGQPEAPVVIVADQEPAVDQEPAAAAEPELALTPAPQEPAPGDA